MEAYLHEAQRGKRGWRPGCIAGLTGITVGSSRLTVAPRSGLSESALADYDARCGLPASAKECNTQANPARQGGDSVQHPNATGCNSGLGGTGFQAADSAQHPNPARQGGDAGHNRSDGK